MNIQQMIFNPVASYSRNYKVKGVQEWQGLGNLFQRQSNERKIGFQKGLAKLSQMNSQTAVKNLVHLLSRLSHRSREALLREKRLQPWKAKTSVDSMMIQQCSSVWLYVPIKLYAFVVIKCGNVGLEGTISFYEFQ